MSTPRCPTCKQSYWRYRGDWPPRGYCSEACYEGRTKRKAKPTPPETSASVLESFREHRISAHQCVDVITWFDCEVCDRFEERYAVSMYL